MKNLIKKRWFILLAVIFYTIIVSGITYFLTSSMYKENVVETSNTNQISQPVEEKENKETKEENEKSKKVSLNETIAEKDWEVTIKETGFKQDIIPSNPNSYYTHYQVKDTSNTYFYIMVEAKNISSLALRADSVAKVKMKYNNQYEYTTFSTIEESGGGTFRYTNITNIDPLTTRNVYYLVEIPKEIEQDTDKSVNVEITINDNTYQLNIR